MQRTILPSDGAPADGAPQHAAQPRRGRRILMVGLVTLALVLVVGGGALGVFYYHLQGNIKAQDLSRFIGSDRPTAARAQKSGGDTSEVNILVMGSDTRKGNRAEGHDVYGAPRSDTTILLHLAQGRRSAVGVSIPRDSVVDVPMCTRPDGTRVPARHATIFNEAFGDGPACTFRTVEQLTGVHIDHYVVVDFAGFKGMVNALGGVPVCLPQPVDDKLAHLKLSAGKHVVKGEQALGFVRSRHGFGDGSDLGRINRQQTFLSSMIQKATSAGTLTNPVRLIQFLDAATKSLTTDPGLANLNTMRKLAQSVQAVPSRDITFLTIPNEAYTLDPNRVQWKQPQADAVWAAVRDDQPVPGTRAYRLAHAGNAARATLTVRPAAVRVRMVNASGVPGLGSKTAQALRQQGFLITSITSGPVSASTVVRHGTAAAKAALTVAAAVPGSTDQPAPDLGSTVELVIGANFGGTTVVPTTSVPATAPTDPPLATRTADQSICS